MSTQVPGDEIDSTVPAGGRWTAGDLIGRQAILVSLPEIYLRARQALDDPESGLADLAAVISQDPGMTARLLKLANSALYGFVAEVCTVTQATTLLGAGQINELVLLTAVSRSFRGISNRHMNMDVYWQTSVHCAALSSRLGLRCGSPASDGLFVAGLLHDLGHLLMYEVVPGASEEALLRSRSEQRPLYLLERETIGCDYAQVGGALLASWCLPELLVDAVKHHTEPAAAPRDDHLAWIVHLAQRIAASAPADIPLREREFAVPDQVQRLLGLDDRACAAACAQADDLSREMLAVIFPGHA